MHNKSFERILQVYSSCCTEPPKIHLGVKWAKVGPHARDMTHHDVGNKPSQAAVQTVETLFQMAEENNAQYAAYASKTEPESNSMSDIDCSHNDMDVSMVTYASKSPKCPPSQHQQELDDIKSSLANMLMYTILKPKFEILCGLIDNNPALISKGQNLIGMLCSEIMAEKQNLGSTNDKSKCSLFLPPIELQNQRG